jgi:hypothetical protein
MLQAKRARQEEEKRKIEEIKKKAEADAILAEENRKSLSLQVI